MQSDYCAHSDQSLVLAAAVVMMLFAEAVRRLQQGEFSMSDGDDLHEQILRVETHLEKLTDAVEKCRKIDLISKVADIVGGGLLILATTLGVVGFNPAVTMGSIAAVIAGTVIFGSNASTLKQTAAAVKAAETHRAELISRLDFRVVGNESPRTVANGAGARASLSRGHQRLQNGP
jgi:hypothetical protein